MNRAFFNCLSQLLTVLPMMLLGLVFASCASPTLGADRQPDFETKNLELRAMSFSTKTYRRAALTILMQDASRMADALKLPERLPITDEDVQWSYIPPPFYAEHDGQFGSLATSLYRYIANEDNILCTVKMNVKDSGAFVRELQRRYATTDIASHAIEAYKLATNWLVVAGVDVKALESEASLTQEDRNSLPYNRVLWRQPGVNRFPVSDYDDGFQTVASVWVIVPERRLIQLSVDARYFKKRPLVVPECDKLLQDTEDEEMRKVLFTTDDYKTAALAFFLKDVNALAQELKLPEALPVQKSSLVSVRLQTPYFATRGDFGAIVTPRYVYTAMGDDKLSSIRMNLSVHERAAYLAKMKQKYAGFQGRSNTNEAYKIATNWLATLSVSVPELEREYQVRFEPWDLRQPSFPLYDVTWVKGDAEAETIGAQAALVIPEKTLISLTVWASQYLKRAPIPVPPSKPTADSRNIFR